MLSNAQMDLSGAIEDLRGALARATQASAEVQVELSSLREMHSRLSALNVERQKTIEALVDVANDLYAIVRIYENDPARGPLNSRFAAAMKLAGREPKI